MLTSKTTFLLPLWGIIKTVGVEEEEGEENLTRSNGTPFEFQDQDIGYRCPFAIGTTSHSCPRSAQSIFHTILDVALFVPF